MKTSELLEEYPADQDTIERWFREYNLLGYDEHLTPKQLDMFRNQYEYEGVEQIDNGDEFFEWMQDFAIDIGLKAAKRQKKAAERGAPFVYDQNRNW